MGNAFANQDIAQFYSVGRSTDFARNNLFRVTSINPARAGAGVIITPADLVYLTTANIPGRTINNVAVPFMGLTFNVPGTVSYPGSNAWNVTFRCNGEYAIRKALDQWSRSTFDNNTSTGSYQLGDTGSLTMVAFGTKSEEKVKISLEGLYCTNVGEMAYNVTDAGQVVTVQATLAYSYWHYGDSEAGSTIP